MSSIRIHARFYVLFFGSIAGWYFWGTESHPILAPYIFVIWAMYTIWEISTKKS